MTEEQSTTASSAPSSGAAANRSVTAFFDTSEAADQAKQDLLAAGIPMADIRVAGGPSSVSDADPHPHGFWETLKDFFVPQADRLVYAEGIRRGGFALSVTTDAARYNDVIDLLDRDGAVDVEERSAGWRDEGWTGTSDAAAWAAEERAFVPPSAGTAGFGASMADQPLVTPLSPTGEIEPGLVPDLMEDRMRAETAAPGTVYAAGAPGLGDTSRDATARPGETQAAPAAVRDTSHGRTRVRTYLADESSEGGLPPL